MNRKYAKRKGLKNPVGDHSLASIGEPHLAHHTIFTYVISNYSLISNLEFLFIHFSNQYCSVLCVSHLIFALYKLDTMGIPLQTEKQNMISVSKVLRSFSVKNSLCGAPVWAQRSLEEQHIEVLPLFASLTPKSPRLKADNCTTLFCTALECLLPGCHLRSGAEQQPSNEAKCSPEITQVVKLLHFPLISAANIHSFQFCFCSIAAFQRGNTAFRWGYSTFFILPRKCNYFTHLSGWEWLFLLFPPTLSEIPNRIFLKCKQLLPSRPAQDFLDKQLHIC